MLRYQLSHGNVVNILLNFTVKKIMQKCCIGIALAAAILTACGGGGDSSNGTSSAQLPPAPNVEAAATATIGDTYSYRHTTKNLDTGSRGFVDYSTRIVSNVASNGAISVQYLFHRPVIKAPSSYQQTSAFYDIDSAGQLLGFTSQGCRSTPNPPYHLVALYSISAGTNWKYSGVTSADCVGYGAGLPTTIAFEDSVAAQEPVTVPAGTFNAFKVTRNGTMETHARKDIRKRTCWWESELRVEVKCIDETSSLSKLDGRTSSDVKTDELMGYSNQKFARKTETVTRFVGYWGTAFEGIALNQDVTGMCTFLFDADGNTEGCSYFKSGIRFTVTGKVSADGSLVLNLSNGSAIQSFTGKLDNIKIISGALNPSNPSDGTWSMIQQGT